MDFRTKDVITASVVTGIGAMWLTPELGNIGGALAAATVNVGLFHMVQAVSGWRARHAADLLLNSVCPSCLVPNYLVEVTSEDGQPYRPPHRIAECRACKQCFQVSERDDGLIAQRLGKIGSWE